MARKKADQSTRPPPGAHIGNKMHAKSIVDACQKVINDIIPLSPHIQVKPLEHGYAQSTYRLSHVVALEVVLDERPLKIVPILILSTSPIEYWLSISIDISSEAGTFYLTHTSLVVFERNTDKRTLDPRFRAEWDCRRPGAKSKTQIGPGPIIHAQPHWHVYSSAPNREVGKVEYPFQLEGEPRDFASPDDLSEIREFVLREDQSRNDAEPEAPWLGGESFHFAMAARWQSNPTHSADELLDPTQLANWLKGCLSYSINQLRYMNGP